MRKCFPMFLAAALGCGAAWAQQNVDISVLFGNPGSRAYTVAGTDITASGTNAYTSLTSWGYQIERLGSGSLWVQWSGIDARPDDLAASLPGSGKTTWQTYAAGVRIMEPLVKRLSVYGLTEVGGGLFHAVGERGGSSPSVYTVRTFHGVFEFGGGMDFRLVRWFSLRAEFRDLVTGDQLGGAAGRQHPLPMFGIAFHI